MNINTREVQAKAIEKLKSGKENFNTAKDKSQMRVGYEEFYEGIKILSQLQQYEKGNPAAYKIIGERIQEYITDLKKMKEVLGSCTLPETAGQKPSGGSNNSKGPDGGKGGGWGGDDKGDDDENAKFKNSLREAIVQEKPDVSWDDVAGLEVAKNTLKEAILLPRKFPDIFVGLREPWKGKHFLAIED
jgi:vacuolar protein-sorting-associated protein 4